MIGVSQEAELEAAVIEIGMLELGLPLRRCHGAAGGRMTAASDYQKAEQLELEVLELEVLDRCEDDAWQLLGEAFDQMGSCFTWPFSSPLAKLTMDRPTPEEVDDWNAMLDARSRDFQAMIAELEERAEP